MTDIDLPSFRWKAPATLNGHKDGSFFQKRYQFKPCNKGENTEEQTLATSYPMLTNTPSFFMRDSNSGIMFCLFDTALEILVALDTMAMTTGPMSFCADA
jgi:hypothetical protein